MLGEPRDRVDEVVDPPLHIGLPQQFDISRCRLGVFVRAITRTTYITSRVTVASTETVRVEDKCREASLMIPFRNIRTDYILRHVELYE